MQAEFASACILSYQRASFVETTILTAAKNALYPLEVIVHDDGSDDETLRTLLSLREQGLISTLILNQRGHNEGQGVAMNRMAAVAHGDPIIKLDHDLILEPGWLQKSVNVLQNNETRKHEPNIGALGLFPYFNEPVKHSEMLVKKHVGWEEHRDFVGSAMVIPRRAWKKFGPWGERSTAFAEDAIFKHQIAETPGWCCGLTNDVLVVNQGFGPGPSTVVFQAADGSIGVHEIKPESYVIHPEQQVRVS